MRAGVSQIIWRLHGHSRRHGLYLNSDGNEETDNINVIYADTPVELEEDNARLAKYTDELKAAVLAATNEEDILVVVHKIYHSV